jgi:hypothetical protein
MIVMQYKTKSGYVITDEMLEQFAEACERGEYPGTPGEFIVAPPGRPQLYPSEELVTIAVKVPRSFRDKLDEKAKAEHETRSQLLRKILNDTLATT